MLGGAGAAGGGLPGGSGGSVRRRKPASRGPAAPRSERRPLGLHELIRPRGPVRHRFYRGGRRWGRRRAPDGDHRDPAAHRAGERIAHAAVVRVQLAGQHRDDVKAEALAYSGIAFHRLVLIASKALGRNEMFASFGAMLGGGNAQELWQALPFVDTRMMRLLFVSDGSADEEELVSREAGGPVRRAGRRGREATSMMKRNFLDFDGDFRSDVQDEERRINVGNMQATNLGDLLVMPAAMQLMALFSTEETQDYLYDNNLVKEELIANLVDWTDADDMRLYQGGNEERPTPGSTPPTARRTRRSTAATRSGSWTAGTGTACGSGSAASSPSTAAARST